MIALQSRSWMIAMVLVCLVVRLSAAADDVIVENAVPGRPLRNFQGRVFMDAETIERMVFGTDGKAGRSRIDAQVRMKIREFENRYELTDAIRDKLLLASRSDKQRFFKSLEELKQKSSVVGGDQNQFRDLQREAMNLRAKVQDLFGSSSFFGKTARTILADAAKRGVTKGANSARAASPEAVPAVDANNGLRAHILNANAKPAEAAPLPAVRVKRLVVRMAGSSSKSAESAVDALVPANEGGK